jgi:hypothetical protein
MLASIPAVRETFTPVRFRRVDVAAVAVLAAAVLAVLPGAARAGKPEMVNAPSISGVPMEGETLTAHPGTYAVAEPPFSFTYSWLRCGRGGDDCSPLGVTGTVYTLTAQDIGWRIRTLVMVTGQDCGEWRRSDGGRECQPVTVPALSELTPVIDPNLRPQSTAPPTISGTPEEQSTLTAQDGGWVGPQPITTQRQWERCAATGDACQAIPGATASTYTLGLLDIGKVLRVVVWASNSRGGTGPAVSALTPVVRAYLPRPGRTTIDAARVAPPHRFVIDRFSFAPTPLRAVGAVRARFRVSDTRGFRVRRALVDVTSVPAGLLAPVNEVRTGADGWATLRLTPTARVVFRRGGSIRLVVTARQPDAVAVDGVAAQRRVSLPLGAPAR